MSNEEGLNAQLEARAASQRKWSIVMAGLMTHDIGETVEPLQVAAWLQATGLRLVHAGELTDADAEADAVCLAFLDLLSEWDGSIE